MTTAVQAQTIVDDYEADRAAYWAANSSFIMKTFYDKIENKSKLGLEATVFSYNDMDAVQKKYLDYVKLQLLADEYEIGDVNGVMDVRW